MLVLSRKEGEALRIGPNLRVVVVSVSSHQVRLAIEAPEHVAIHREEVFERIADANRQAARPAKTDADALAAIEREGASPAGPGQ